VSEAVSGYAGGISESPAYKTLEGTGHYEVVKITYDTSIVTQILNATTFYDAENYHQNYYKGQKIVLTRFGPVTRGETVVGPSRGIYQPLKAITSKSSGITSAVPGLVTLRAAAKLAIKSAAFGTSPSDRRPIK